MQRQVDADVLPGPGSAWREVEGPWAHRARWAWGQDVGKGHRVERVLMLKAEAPSSLLLRRPPHPHLLSA